MSLPRYPRRSSSINVLLMPLMACGLFTFAHGAPADAATAETHPTYAEVVDISKEALSTTSEEEPAATSTVPIDLHVEDRLLGEAVTDALERGRGKRARFTTQGSFVITDTQGAAGGSGEELELGESSLTADTTKTIPAMTASEINQGTKSVILVSTRNNKMMAQKHAGVIEGKDYDVLDYNIDQAVFKVEKHGSQVAFKSQKDGKYLSDQGHRVEAKADQPGGWEKFTVVDAGNKIALKSGKSNQYCSNEETKIVCNRNHPGGWEKFIVIPFGPGIMNDQNPWKSAKLNLDAIMMQKASLAVEAAATNGPFNNANGPMSFQWCKDNPDHGVMRKTKGIFKGGSSSLGGEIYIQAGSGGPSFELAYHTAIRYGVHDIADGAGDSVKLCAAWASACVPMNSNFLSEGVCGTKRIIFGCNHERVSGGQWQEDCRAAAWEIPFA